MSMSKGIFALHKDMIKSYAFSFYTRCTAQEAIQNNFGGSDSSDDNTNTNTLTPAARQSTNAYM